MFKRGPNCCQEDAECDDKNPCTDDVCHKDTDNQCTHNPLSGARCDDGNACTVDDACKGGMCVGQLRSDGTHCDDGNACTVDDACSRGMCVGQPRSCDDGKDCSDDFPCDPATGRCPAPDIHRCPCATDAECDDHDPCTGRETCDVGTGTCSRSAAPRCDDRNDCTDDPCLPREGCKHVEKFLKSSFDSVKCSVPGSPPACAGDPKTIRQLVKRATNLIEKAPENRRCKRTIRARKLLESTQNLGSISDACRNKLTDIERRIDDWFNNTDCPEAPRS